MRVLSVCSGIEAATVAWEPLGWCFAAYAEIDAFASAVLAYRYPEVRNLGDFTKIRAQDAGAIDLLTGGTPCQSFSVAGLRGGLDDDRGNLALEFLRLAQRTRPRWLVWENVPGVLSSNKGRDFGAILGGMVKCGYGFSYRVLDAQYFGLAQRRKCVFVVGHLGDWRPAAAVLFERESLQGHPSPRREAGEDPAGTLNARSSAGGGLGTDFECSGGLIASGHSMPVRDGAIVQAAVVRKLTPRECERLQGFPDDYTLIPMNRRTRAKVEESFAAYMRRSYPEMTDAEIARLAADGPRYCALGNSMAVPVMHWIGKRIQKVEHILSPE